MNYGIVLRVCKLCSEPDWRSVPVEIGRIVRERLLRALQVVQSSIAAEGSGDDSMAAEIDRSLAQLRGQLWEARGDTWEEIVDFALIAASARLKKLGRPAAEAASADPGDIFGKTVSGER